MKRDIEKELAKWKKDRDRKPLLLRGARQVGKTYIIEKFGREHFESFLSINLERNPELCSIFESLDPKKIIGKLQVAERVSIVPGETLLFIDEIQACPHAIMALRYFKEEMPMLHIVGAGSLLEFILNDKDFRMPVGRVQFLYLYPLSFEEFLEASGEKQTLQWIKSVQVEEAADDVIHQKCMKLVREYMVVGGMPEVLRAYLNGRDYLHCREIQTDLLSTYRNDFGKYAKASQHKYLQMLFERAPGLIAQWFKYSKIDPDVQSRDLKSALHQLGDAGLIHFVHATSATGLPLIATAQLRKFKILFLDIGLTHCAMQLDLRLLLDQNLLLINKGALAEQYVGQQLLVGMDRRQVGKLFFWVREAKSSSAEVDYITTFDSQIVPLEVKAGATGRLRSLQLFLTEKKLPLGVRVSTAPLSRKENILNIPLYMISQISRFI